MPVQFVVHEVARESFSDWQRRLAGHPRGGAELHGTFVRALQHELIRTCGRPEGAYFMDGVEPPLGVWEFLRGHTWIAYAVHETGGRWAKLFRRTGIRVIVLNLYDHPPHRDELALLLQTYADSGRGRSA
jgi:hypothetical protein